ncbi:alpha/beta hydrolase [Streptomyces sp. 7R007]
MFPVLRVRRGVAGIALAAVAATLLTVLPGTRAEAADAVGVVEYNLGDEAFTDPPDWDGAAEIRAVVHYPLKAAGRLPVVVLLHGQQLACYSADEADWESWPCPAGVAPYPSYRGYDYLAEALARDGFVVVSPSADGVNHFMGVAPQRAHLLDRHLELLRQLDTTGGGPLAGHFTDPRSGRPVRVDFRHRLDLTRVGTMGHSVGGEGVMYQAADAHRGELPAGVRIRGVVAVASPGPSGFYDTLVTRTPLAVVSAGCWSLGGETYFEEARGRAGARGFRLRVTKGNHNFYNTEWTVGPGPTDGDDTTCPDTAGRPTATQQQNLAVTYLRAFYAYALKHDRSALPVLTGARAFPGVDTQADSYGATRPAHRKR